jgi:predicted signal transduction protein with EAL and GGDEF domain
MDDFGTGYASLGYLQKFRFDKIKIDRSFVKNLGVDPNAAAIVRAVVGLGDALGMETNAEGVENDSQIEMLRSHGCREVQGFRYWAPMPASALWDLVDPSGPASNNASFATTHGEVLRAAPDPGQDATAEQNRRAVYGRSVADAAIRA